jgi:ABC-type dipeptide/oligopeptide/nickel transport system permease subunit
MANESVIDRTAGGELLSSLRASRSVTTPSLVIGSTILLAWLGMAVFAVFVAPHDPLATVSGARQPPSLEHWFGTDRLGRDVLSRVIFGARVSLVLGFISVAIGSLTGTALGLVSGYYRGFVDTVSMRAVDAMLALPGILLALVVIAALGPSITHAMIAVGVSTIPRYARLVRGTVLSVREQPYIDAARLLGVSDVKIMLRHVLPNAAVPLLVLSTLEFGNAISVGAALSFLGLGAQPPTPEWGLMAAVGREVLGRAWWISTFPGLAIFTVVMATNLLGDSLQKILDPRLRSR